MEKSLKQARKLEREPRCSAGSPEAPETKSTGPRPAPGPETPEAGPGQGCCWVTAGWEMRDCRGGGGGSWGEMWLGATLVPS